MDLKNEIWKPLINYEEEYDISNYGKVRSKARLVDYSRAKALKAFALL